MGLFSRAFKSKDASNTSSKSKKRDAQTNGAVPAPPPKPLWDDAWTRKTVEPEEVQELLRVCTQEMKSRALDMPFFLLPFRPASDPSAARTFIRNYFNFNRESLKGDALEQELVLTEPMVLSSVMKWCWSRLAGGIVTWEAYELFKVGEQDSNMARNAFATFIPLSIDSDARTKIIFDFFDLMAAVAAHGKTNGMGGRKLSRFAGWWAFEHTDEKNGFDGGYRSWSHAADATSHLFFAYLRSLSPDSVRGLNGVSTLPLSLQTLLQETRYPPEHLAHHSSSKVVMVVDSISPTPFALLRRAKNFEYRDDDRVLQAFSNYDDPVQALSDECRRVLKSISSVNDSNATTTEASTSLGDTSWSRFEDLGFGAIGEDDEPETTFGHSRKPTRTLQSAPQTKGNDLGRPTTPSWADFLNSGFVDEPSSPAPRPLILPPDKILPPIDLDSKRGKSSQSHVRKTNDADLEPGELASINALQLDDAFWWVWITSLAGEETLERKAVFGRCALLETVIGNAWLVIEEMVKGAAPEPEVGAYIAEKKSRFTFGKKRTPGRRGSMGKKTQPPRIEQISRNNQASPASKTSIGPDQHARIQAAAAALQEKQRQRDNNTIATSELSPKRGRRGDAMSTKTNSVFTLQPVIMSEAAPAMKWATSYDKKEVRAKYLGNELAGKGSSLDLGALASTMAAINGSTSPKPPAPVPKDTPPNDYGFPKEEPKAASVPLPPETPGERLQAPSGAPPPVPSAPLPSEPISKPANQVAAAAAEVPLPAPEGERLEKIDTDTDGRQDAISPQSSPESKRTGKLRKKEGRNFKGLFGKKKQQQPPAPPSKPTDPLAAAAARAALSPRPQNQGSNSLTRRLSRMGRKENTAPPPPMPVTTDEEPLEPPQAPFRDEYDSQVTLSRVDSNEQREADQEFPKFDQGPLTDQPAFLPDESPVHRESTVPADSTSVSRPSTAEPVGAHYDPPITKGGDYEPSLSTDGGELEQQQTNGVEDRWAQIRKNAAERAAMNGNGDDQATAGRKSADTNGEGEDSGEETIESRVARIKARVAELTGGMQGPDSTKSSATAPVSSTGATRG